MGLEGRWMEIIGGARKEVELESVGGSEKVERISRGKKRGKKRK